VYFVSAKSGKTQNKKRQINKTICRFYLVKNNINNLNQ